MEKHTVTVDTPGSFTCPKCGEPCVIRQGWQGGMYVHTWVDGSMPVVEESGGLRFCVHAAIAGCPADSKDK